MQLPGDISTCGATAKVFAQPRPTSDIGQIEIPQRSTLMCRTVVCYPFGRKHGKAPGNETARVHRPARRRGGRVVDIAVPSVSPDIEQAAATDRCAWRKLSCGVGQAHRCL